MKVEDSQIQQTVAAVLDKYRNDQGLLVSILQDIQTEYNYLSQDAIVQVSRGLGIPLAQVYSVATFFKAFSLTPRGRHLAHVCLGTACHVRGAVRILEEIERQLGIKAGETTKDLKYTVETVNCVGACALGPIVMVGNEYTGEMKTNKVKSLLGNYD